MNDLADVFALVQTHQIKQALIIDDAYDTVPFADDLLFSDTDAAATALYDRSSGPVRKVLGAILEEKGFDSEDFAAGLKDDSFVEKLWKLAQAGKLAKQVVSQLFGSFEAVQASKKKQLEYLEEFLSKSKIEFTPQGRREMSGPENVQIIFLDLYLGITDTEAALEDAVERIRGLLEGKPDEQRPLIVVMSTTGSTRLYDVASELQVRAELIGCKFRAINKEDFPKALPKALMDLLNHKDDAQRVAKWMDGWFDAISSAAVEYRKHMRLLDLSDLAYLFKFRLEDDSTALGEYLNSMSSTYVQFCIEKQLASGRFDRLLDDMKFEKFPASHFLPSVQIPKLKYASSFVCEDVIRSEGYNFDEAKSVLQLGDLIVEKPKKWEKNRTLDLHDQPVFVVISQACDIAQKKSDAILMLRGIVRRRDWTAAISNRPETTDVFLYDKDQFQIEWQKAQISAWPVKFADRRLAKKGNYLRIGRFRDVEALKLQQIFASNLTRVGTIAAPHQHIDVGISLTAPAKAGGYVEIFRFTPLQRIAAVMQVRPVRGETYQVLIFNGDAAERIAGVIADIDLSTVKDPFAGQIRALVKSPAQLNTFNVATKIKSGLDFGSGVKIDTKWLKSLDASKDKDPRDLKLVMALSTIEES
ncbi:hypothetical protein ACVWZM_006040 [Bradyrhizobium sp. USDA 4501]